MEREKERERGTTQHQRMQSPCCLRSPGSPRGRTCAGITATQVFILPCTSSQFPYSFNMRSLYDFLNEG